MQRIRQRFSGYRRTNSREVDANTGDDKPGARQHVAKDYAITSFVIITICFILVCVAIGLNFDSQSKCDEAIDYLNSQCCRTGFERSGIGSCIKGKADLLKRLDGQGPGNTLPTDYLHFENATLAFCWILLAAIAIILFMSAWFYSRIVKCQKKIAAATKENSFEVVKEHSEMVKKSKQRYVQTQAGGFITVLIIGSIAMILSSLNHGYIAFQEWPEAWAAAGCCCCVPSGLAAGSPQTCMGYQNESFKYLCNTTSEAQHCYTSAQLESYGYDNLQKPVPHEDGWQANTFNALVLIIVSTVVFMFMTGAIFVKEKKRAKTNTDESEETEMQDFDRRTEVAAAPIGNVNSQLSF